MMSQHLYGVAVTAEIRHHIWSFIATNHLQNIIAPTQTTIIQLRDESVNKHRVELVTRYPQYPDGRVPLLPGPDLNHSCTDLLAKKSITATANDAALPADTS